MDIAKIRKKLKELEAGDRRTKVNEPAASPAEAHDTHASAANYGQPAAAEDNPPDSGQSIEAGPDIDRKQVAGDKVLEEPKNKEEKSKDREADKKTGAEHEEVVEILTFGLIKEEFAFRISQLEEILRHQRITKVPRAPKYVLGITSLRGKIVPVIDLKLRLSLTTEPSNIDQTGKILIIKGPKGPIGATADRVIGVVRKERSEILPPPSHLSEAELKFIDGIVIVEKRFVSIINVEETVSLGTKWT